MDTPNAQAFFGRLLTAEEARTWRGALRAAGKRVVFTNGVFDVLHAGHVAYLAWARAQGDALIVGLNTDDSVRKIKGERRPIVPFAERARVLCALRSIDAVVPFGERTPEILLDKLEVDVHVKSAQYREDELPERDVVLAHGGTIALAPHVPGTSTTDTIARIIDRYCAPG
ncbi:MAG TPA: adenylyltransferase/cytidyltransferase family protein [Candidatus Baltobacteraceae bacterium]|jgi:rfaE bifunctional protein nucleotidyltransferase chain/domain|nr:adenylyltransferase/cytidyltransferase family protein [Candidatus Baltobacteraceae bacterium]